jgi:hypothetical protein
MNKHWVMGLAALVALAACSRSTQLAVRAVSEGADGEVTGRAQLIVRALPFDRDSIFSALAAQAAEPEPQPPAELVELRDSVSSARQRWTDAESSWNAVRAELQSLSERMEDMDRSSAEYRDLYLQFDNLDAQVGRLERDKTRYFDAFTGLQESYQAQADSFGAVLQAWEERAFVDYNEITDSLFTVLGDMLEDTTDGSGWAPFSLRRGSWWIYARSRLVFNELYWNVPYQSMGGADTLVIEDSNAEVRPIWY